MGEYAVGAYLKLILECDVVDYKVKRPTKGLESQFEIDLIGLQFSTSTAILCEVKTHILGLLCGSNNKDTIERIEKQFHNMQDYAKNYLHNFENQKFMLWSPYVPEGVQTKSYSEMNGLDLIINDTYTEKIRQLENLAKRNKYSVTKITDNPFFRTLQILGHLRK